MVVGREKKEGEGRGVGREGQRKGGCFLSGDLMNSKRSCFDSMYLRILLGR